MHDDLFAEIDLLSEGGAEQVFWSHKWEDGNPHCDACGSLRWYFIDSRMAYTCIDCRHQYTARSRTIFASSKLTYKQLLKAMSLADEPDLTRKRVRDVLGVSESGASPLLARIRLVRATGSIRVKPQ
jgi:transposase-like protein